jgi:hypothetical protein
MGRVSIHRFLSLGPAVPALAAALLLALAPAGCAVGVGGGGNASASHRGTFVDSTVEGLEFNAGGLVGTTDADGTFAYDPNTPVTFFVGDVIVGTGDGAVVMTPVSLVAGATNETNSTVTNITRFLMTIDDDRDPSNGIQISDAVRAAARGLTVDFTKPASTFAGLNGEALGALAAATTVGGPTVSEGTAQAHLHDSLLELLAGDYGGDYTGDDHGTWVATIDTAGNITGSSHSDVDAENFDLTGTVQTNGKLELSATLGPDFKGTIAADGTISDGLWQRLAPPEGFGDAGTTLFGAFTGIRTK